MKTPPEGGVFVYASDVSRSGVALQLRRIDRQRAHALATRREDGVGERRNDRRQRGLTQPGRVVVGDEEVHLNLRRLVHAQKRVVVEVRLVDTAVGERKRLHQRLRDAVDRATLDLVATRA